MDDVVRVHDREANTNVSVSELRANARGADEPRTWLLALILKLADLMDMTLLRLEEADAAMVTAQSKRVVRLARQSIRTAAVSDDGAHVVIAAHPGTPQEEAAAADATAHCRLTSPTLETAPEHGRAGSKTGKGELRGAMTAVSRGACQCQECRTGATPTGTDCTR